MKNKLRLTAILVAVAMLSVTVFTGCGGSGPGGKKDAAEPAAVQEAQAEAEAPAERTAPAAKAEKKQTPGKPVVNRTVRVDIEKLDSLMNLVSELIIAKNSLVSISSQDENTHTGAFNEQIEYLESVTTNLHESVMKVRMVPIESVVN